MAYDYLRELHRLFNVQPRCLEQRQQLDWYTAELRKRLGAEERKLLLRILDVRDVIAYESSLESFAAGVRLAYGLTCELHAAGRYSYADSEEKRICQAADRQHNGGD